VEAKALNGLLEARIASGAYGDVEKDLERLRVLSQQTGDTRNIAHYTYTHGLLHLRMNRLDEAERCFRTAQALAATLGADVLTLACQNNLGELFRHKGDAQAAESCYRYVARFAADRQWDAHAAVAHLNIAGLMMQRGSPRYARAEVEHAERFLKDSPEHWAWLYVGLCRAVWAAEEADERTCRQWWRLAVERGLGRVIVPELKPLLAHLATLATRRGWGDLARQAQALAG
jgi:tetratricopeptide (TPR) repeat protein